MMKRLSMFKALATAALAAHAAIGMAQDFPTRPVRIVGTSPAGSALDTFGRMLAEDLGKRWNQSVFIEAKSGGGGAIAANAVLHAPADGYTMFLINEQILVANRFAFRKLSYDPDKSFAPISLLVQADQMIVASASAPFKDLPELVAYAKAHPKALSYGMWSQGSSPQLALEMLKRDANIDIAAVPYRGVGPVMQAMQSGEVQLSVVSGPTIAPLLQNASVKPLAVASKQRWTYMPKVATTAELGYPRVLAATWYALVVHANTPPAIRDKMERDVRAIVSDPGFLERHPTLAGWTFVGSTGQELRDTVTQQTRVVSEMMKVANVTPE
jgi:tripartite-type tricarboxylate transporter receptor subunit TctC